MVCLDMAAAFVFYKSLVGMIIEFDSGMAHQHAAWGQTRWLFLAR